MEALRLGKTPIKMPSGWHEVPTGKAIELIETKPNEVQILALLSGKTELEIRSSTDIETIWYLANAYTFLGELPDVVGTFPRSVKMGVDKLILPYVLISDKFDLGHCNSEQVEDMQIIITKMSKEFTGEEERTLTEIELIKITPHIVATYLQPILDKQYSASKANKLVERINEELSFKDCLSMGYFFFKRLTDLRSLSVKNLQTRSSIPRRLKLALWRSMQSLASMPHMIT